MAGSLPAGQSVASCLGRQSQKTRAPVEPPQLCVRGSSDCQAVARPFAMESSCQRVPHLPSFARGCDASAASSSGNWHHARGRPMGGFTRYARRSGLTSGLSTLCTPPSALGEPSDLSRRGRAPTECSAAPQRRPDGMVSTAAVSLGTDTAQGATHKADEVPSTDSSEESSSSSTEESLSHKPQNGAVSELASSSSSSSLSTWNPLAILESKLSPRVRGLVLLNILTFLYGTNVTVVKEAQSSFDPFSFSLGRFAIAAVFFTPFLSRAFKDKAVFRAGIELGIWASLAYITQSVGLITTEAGRAAFIGTFTVIEVPIIAGLFGAKIPRVTWYAAAAAVVGVGLLESAGGNSTFMGDFWTIVSALIFGFHMLRSEHHARHVPVDGALPLIALQLFVTAVMSLAWLVGMSSLHLAPDTTYKALLAWDWDTISSWPWLQMAYTGVLSTAFCLWVEVVSLRDVSAPEAAMVYTLEPLYGAGFAWLLLGERWGPMGWVGASLILGGSVTMQLFGHVGVPEDEPEEIEVQKSSTAILGALGAAAAVALVMAATGGVPGAEFASYMGTELVEGVASAESAWAAYEIGEVELDNLASLMRAYAMVKGEAVEGLEGSEEGKSGGGLLAELSSGNLTG